MSGDATEESGPYDSFLREAARVTDGAPGVGTAPLAAGARLCGDRFEIARDLGKGGMGVVYAAHDRHRGCDVAVKTLRAATLDALHRLRDEFLVVHDLAHPNLVSLGELFDDAGRWFFTMELVDGRDFLAHVRPDGVLDLDRLRGAMAQLASGLGFLHAAGIVHRDVKPSNVLVAGERVVLLDFGLAGAAGGATIAGTLPYMAPEQHDGGAVGPAADWYATGVMLWSALAGRLPFRDEAAKRAGAPAVDGPRELVELARALLDPDPAARPGDAAIARALGATITPAAPITPFVGRTRELAELGLAWSSARQATSAVLVRGGSGAGKSALIAQFARELRDDGALVLVGRCHERVAMPYKAVHGIAAALAAHLRDDAAARHLASGARDVALLPAVFPALAELAQPAAATPVIRDPVQQRTRVFDAFADLIARIAAQRPLAIVIDDAQWADRDGLELLQHAMLAAPRTLVLAAARDVALDDAAAWLAGRTITVGALEPRDAEELARQLGGDAAAGAIAREAAGHPLHIAELTRHWDRGQAGPAPRLEEALASRVAALPPDHARTLVLVALAGAPVPQAMIGAAAALDGGAWWSALAALRAASLVRTHGPRGGDAVEPYHDRVRETVAAALDASARRRAHDDLAVAIEAKHLGDERPDLLAYHLAAADRTSDAAIWYERAGDHAARALAFDRAASHFTHAIDLGVAAHAKLGDALANAGRGAPAAEAYLTAAASSNGDDALELRRRAAEQLLRSGRIDDGIAIIEEVLREVGLPSVHRRWPIAALLGQRALLRVRRARGPAARTPTDDDRRRLACCWSAVVGLAMASPLRMTEYQARHLRLALAANDPRRIALGMAFEATAAALPGPPARRAQDLLDETRRWAEKVGEPFAEAYVEMAAGAIAFLCGRWRESLAHCDAAERLYRNECVGVAWELGSTQRMSLTCLWHMGRIAELKKRISRALDEADRRGDLYAATQLRTVLQPNVCLMDDREADARAELARAKLGLPQREITLQHWQYMQARGLCELYAGDPRAALAIFDEEVPVFRRAYLFRVQAVRAFTAFVQLAARLGALAQGGDRKLEGAIAKQRANLDQGDLERSVPMLVDAELAVLRGDLEVAAIRYRSAAAGFEAVDMTLISSAARWRLGELLGGDEGRTLRTEVEARLAGEGVARPERVVAMFAPVPADARMIG
ncbi:MAG TPA: AAA family ATPase [Kofleriaceae bacterium]|nr:AAA family ATPase [Kofleriaceae bacterium]